MSLEKPPEIPSPFSREFTITRMVMLLEETPLSNIYNQVMLTPEQFLKMSQLLQLFFPAPGVPGMDIPLELRHLKLPEMPTSYPRKKNIEDNV